MTVLVLADALLCLAVPAAARWTVVVVDRLSGADHPLPSVRFRWRWSAQRWAASAVGGWDRRGVVARFEPRPLRPDRTGLRGAAS